MRLLAKSEIDSKKALARKQEIDEGLKISRRVDTLRETVAQEEAALEAFRRKTIAAINAQITAVSDILNDLRREVKELEEKRVKALEPIDTAWETLLKSQQEHTLSVVSLEMRQEVYFEQSKELQARITETTQELERIQTLKKQTEEALQEAVENKADTEASMAYTRDLEHKTEELRVEVMGDIKERDAVCAARERDISIKDESLLIREEAIRKAQILLDDQNAMLERDITRFMKQQNESNSKNRK